MKMNEIKLAEGRYNQLKKIFINDSNLDVRNKVKIKKIFQNKEKKRK